ncbi:MAG: UTRA domain-containing protein [Spiribacter salinus]|uniref:UTRA domain-containing protein n=1 Tax=Spiribacter salinus TaxID=1335746 RepID=A0A540VR73_9GAMM|nr:MAG: UTRA domain-containing protein [Spiribacter salinus]
MQSEKYKTMTSWQAVRDNVLQRIRQHDWPQGSLIPNEAELAEEFGCARSTVNRALRELAATGILERRRKAGTRVAATPARRATFEIPIIEKEVESRGSRYGYVLISQEKRPAPPDIRAQMGLTHATELLHLQSLHLADGTPYIYEDRWINPQGAPGILNVDLETISANKWLVQNISYTHGALTLSAEQASRTVSQYLQCAQNESVFTMHRHTWTNDITITIVTQSYRPKHKIRIDL